MHEVATILGWLIGAAIFVAIVYATAMLSEHLSRSQIAESKLPANKRKHRKRSGEFWW